MRTTAALQLLPTQATAAPGGRLEISLVVTNTGELVDRYAIGISGVPADWVEQDVQTVSLFPGEKKTVHITIQPPSGNATTSGIRPVSVTATSDVDELAATSAEFTLTIQPAGALQFELSPKRVVGRRAQFRAQLDNQSNSPTTFSLMSQDAEQGLNVQPDTEGLMTLAPGERRTVVLAVQPKRRETIGEPHPYDLEAWVLPQGKPADSAPDPALLRRANFTFTPRLSSLSVPLWLRRMPRWLVLLLLLLLLLVIAFAGGRTAASKPAPPPVVVPTRVAPPTKLPTIPIPTIALPDPAVVKGFGITALPDGSVQVNWATSGAEQVVLDDTIVDSSGQETLRLTSARTLILSVTNARGTTSQALVLEPAQTQATGNAVVGAQYLPVVGRFTRTLDPRTGTPTLNWTVTSALKVLIDGKVVSASGRQSEKPGPATYELAASNKFGTVRTTLSVPATAGGSGNTVNVSLPPPTIKTFTLLPPSGFGGNRLQWTTSGAHRVLINDKPVGLSGVLPVGAPRSGQAFTLLADNGYLTSKVTIKLALSGGKGTTSKFTVALPVIKTFAITSSHGGKFMAWRVVGADHSAISGQSVPLTGKAPLPPGYKTLVLEATNDAGSTKVTITVAGATPTRTATRTATRAATRTVTRTTTQTLTATATPTATATARRAFTATTTPHRTIQRLGRTATPTHARPQTRTATPRPIRRRPTRTSTPRATSTGIPTSTPTATPTATGTDTQTATPTSISRRTATPTRRPRITVARPTRTHVPARTPSATRTRIPTRVPTRAATHTLTPAPTHVHTHTPSRTPTSKPKHTKTPTPTRVFTHTAVPTHTGTPTRTPTAIPATINVAPNPLALTDSGASNSGAAPSEQGTLTISNAGPGALSGPISVTLAAGSAAEFGLVGGANPCSSVTSMALGATCTDIVVFKGCYNGTAPTASVTILAPHAANGAQTVPVSFAPGQGQCAAGISVAPSSVTFVPCPTTSGGTAICDAVPSPIVVTVTNTGDGTLVIGTLTARTTGNGGTFGAIKSPACVAVAPGGQCTITVTFNPSEAGLYQAVGGVLLIDSNAAQGEQSITLSWPGAPPPTVVPSTPVPPTAVPTAVPTEPPPTQPPPTPVPTLCPNCGNETPELPSGGLLGIAIVSMGLLVLWRRRRGNGDSPTE